MNAPGPSAAGDALARDTFAVFGTTAVLLVTDPGVLGRARALADAELAAVDRAANRFRPDSEISRLNRAAGAGPLAVSGLLAELIGQALRAAELTGGAVDPTCGQALAAAGYDRDFGLIRDGGARQGAPRRARPRVPGAHAVRLDASGRVVRLDDGARLDLGATAKAWAADRCADLIASALACGVLVSLGGDIAVAGPPPDGGWRVRVTDDHAAGPDSPGQVVTITSGGLATSSITVRAWTLAGQPRHHIIDPATGAPAAGCWRTVSVSAGTCTDANIAATAAIVKGESALAWLASAGLPARLVRHDGAVVTASGWPGDNAQPATRRRAGGPARLGLEGSAMSDAETREEQTR